MKPLTDTQLEALLGDLVSDRVERKESWSGNTPDNAREAVCAFAYDVPHHRQPGVLFVGAGDDGMPANTPVTDQDERILNERRRHRDIPYDIRPVPSAKLTDLSRSYFEETYLPNPHIAEAMCVFNLVQRFGVGISIARSSLRDDGNPPVSFEVQPNVIFARIQPAELQSPISPAP